MRQRARMALVKRGRISMKKLFTVLLMLMMPRSIRDCNLPVSLPSLLKNAIRKERMRSTTFNDMSRETRMRIRSP